ncbi:hypothetical protein LOD99_4278 [Oopsacas minuta]|uniref:Glycosyltransferase n=1 Tax=Oopsacas minuta TaxID=111878 RepID=A0AAV7JVF1_9METZ|nr:hypothetical protein LOD99_4278 [Oopsacas minuta]
MRKGNFIILSIVILLLYTLITIYLTSHVGDKDYEEYMKSEYFKQIENTQGSSEISLYDQIPKVFHFIWVSSSLDKTRQSNLDVKILSNIQTCLDKHPDWSYKIWTDDMVRREYPVVSEQLLQFGKPAIISEILRFNILASYGGIYMDTDFICFRSFAPFLKQQYCTAFACSEEADEDNEYDKLVSLGVIGAVPGHMILERAATHIITAARGPESPNERTGSHFFMKMIKKYNTQNDCLYVYSKKGFYDCGYQERTRCGARFHSYKNNSDIYAMHLWEEFIET